MVSIITGAITGLLGPIVGGIFKYKEKKMEVELAQQNNAHEVAMIKAESDAMVMEAKANIKIVQEETEGAVELREVEGYIKAQELGNKDIFSNKWVDLLLNIEGYLFIWTNKEGVETGIIPWKILTVPVAVTVALLFGLTDFLRGVTRPFLTIYLCGCTTWVVYMSWEIMKVSGTDLTPTQASFIFSEVTSIVTYLTTSSVTYWFGDRAMSKWIMNKAGVDTNKLDDKINI